MTGAALQRVENKNSGNEACVFVLLVLRSSDPPHLLDTGSHDRSIRVWNRSQEMLNVEEEAEMEREVLHEEEQVRCFLWKSRRVFIPRPLSRLTRPTLK